MARVTFSLDDETVEQIRRTAARLQRPQSHVVRDAVADYAARSDRRWLLAVAMLLAAPVVHNAAVPTVLAAIPRLRDDRQRLGRAWR